MNAPSAAVLATCDDTAPSLERVTATGRASGPLLSMTVRQHYRNCTRDPIEAVYTFPLAWGAVLTGLSVEIDGRRLDGAVLPREEAQARYETSIGDGDAPIMVEQSSDALYTANLGSLKPGEAATIELRYAQLLDVEQGRVRLSVPTTIAPRYGDPARDAGLREHESVGAGLSAAYPFEFTLQVDGALAAGAIASPTHAIEVTRGEAVAQVRLARDGWLDRDLVLTFEAPAGAAAAHALRAPDGDGCVVLASFRPALGTAARGSVDVKLLVDCSGSMAGDSIASARRGLHRALAELRPSDRFSYSRFGSSVEHAFDAPCVADAATVAAAARCVDATRADLGGTEMHAALASTFALGDGEPADVLLVTDGEVWAIDAIVAAARASGHRVFAVGVGSAPAESLLRRLAEATGGACELVSPNESIEAAIGRMFARLRAGRAHEATVRWGVEPSWSTQVPQSVFEGDTVHVVAGFASPRAAVAPRLVFTVDGEAVPREIEAPVEDAAGAVAADAVGAVHAAASADPVGPAHAAASADDEPIALVLPRVAAARRILDATSRLGARGAIGGWARELAVRHRLVTNVTNLFLVHVRADADKATGLPALQRIEQMLAAGWGGTGSVGVDALATRETVRPYVVVAARTPRRSQRHGAVPSDALRAAPPLAMCAVPEDASVAPYVPAFLRRSAAPGRTSPRRLLATLRAGLATPSRLAALVPGLERAVLPDEVLETLREIEAAGASREDAWALVLAWLAGRLGDGALPGEAARRALEVRLASVPAAQREAAERIAMRRLAAATLEGW